MARRLHKIHCWQGGITLLLAHQVLALMLPHLMTPSVRSTAEMVFIRSSVHVQVILDTFLFTPVHVLGFFGWMNAVDGGTLQVVSARQLAIGCIYNSLETLP